MGLTRRLLKGLLRKYLKNLQQRHLHVDVVKGSIRVDEADVNLAPLQQPLAAVLPAGLELTQIRATDVKVKVPWKRLRSSSIVVNVGTVTLTVRQHPVATCWHGEKQCECWASSLARRRIGLHEAYMQLKQTKFDQSNLGQIVGAGLQLTVETVDVVVERCCRTESVPQVAVQVSDVSWGPSNPKLPRFMRFSRERSLAWTDHDLRIGAATVSVHDTSAGGLKRLLQPIGLCCQVLNFMPSDGRAVCPFGSSARVEVELQAACVAGTQEQVMAIAQIVLELVSAENFIWELMAPWLWSNKQHDALAPSVHPPSTGTSKPTSSMSPARTASGKDTKDRRIVGQRSFLPWFISGQQKSKPETQAKDVGEDEEGGDGGSTGLGSMIVDGDNEDDDCADSDGDDLASFDGMSAISKEELMDLTCADTEADPGTGDGCDDGETAGGARAAPGSTRQLTLTVHLPNLHAGLTAPSATSTIRNRLDLSVSGFSFRCIHRSWLTEAQQQCAARFGGDWAQALMAPHQERGCSSLDGVVCSQHELSVHRCRFDLCADGAQLLVESQDPREEMVVAMFQAPIGEPSQGQEVNGGQVPMPIWPVEVTVRSVRICFAPKVFEAIGRITKPLFDDVIEAIGQINNILLDEKKKDAELAEQKGMDGSNGPLLRREADLALMLALRNVQVQEAISENGKGMPHFISLDSLVVENVSRDFRELLPIFGLAKSESGTNIGAATHWPDVDGMDVEQLKAEVQMWRLRNGR